MRGLKLNSNRDVFFMFLNICFSVDAVYYKKSHFGVGNRPTLVFIILCAGIEKVISWCQVAFSYPEVERFLVETSGVKCFGQYLSKSTVVLLS